MSNTEESDFDVTDFSFGESDDDNDKDSDWTLSANKSDSSKNRRISKKNDQSDEESNLNILEFTGSNSRCGDAQKANSELDFFYCVFPFEIIKLIANETNKCMHRALTFNENNLEEDENGKPTVKRFRRSCMHDITENDIIRFFALILAMGHVRKEKVTDYWTTDPLFETPFFRKCLSSSRYRTIVKFLSFEDYNNTPNKHYPSYDNLWEIRNLLCILNRKFKEVYNPTEEIIFDKVVLTANGIRRYVTKDREIPHIKMYRLIDKNGYLYNSDFHKGKEQKFCDLSLKTSVHHSVNRLIQCVSKKGHKLFISNRFFSSGLCQHLYRVHRINCFQLKDSDKKDTSKENSGCKHLSLKEAGNSARTNSYNDMINHNFTFSHRSGWVKKIFFHLLDFAVSNACVLFEMAKNDVSLKDFRIKLIGQLVEASTEISVELNPECAVGDMGLDFPGNDIVENHDIPEEEMSENDDVQSERSYTLQEVLDFTSSNKICGAAEKAHSELDFFYCMLPPDLIQLVADKTNDCLQQSLGENSRDSELSRKKKRVFIRKISSVEIIRFIAIRLAMNFSNKENCDDYWTTDYLLGTPIFGRIMSSRKFFSIMKFLNFESDNEILDVDDRNRDNLWKIREFFDNFNRRFKEVYYPSEELIVDKLVLTSNGLKHYSPADERCMKLKVYRLVDKHGYLFNFDFYLGKEKGNQNLIKTNEEVVKHLVQCISGKGHKLFVSDNLSSSDLIQDLYDVHKINSHGLICSIQKDELKEKFKINKGGHPLLLNDVDNLMKLNFSNGVLTYEQTTMSEFGSFPGSDETKLFFLYLDFAVSNAHILFKLSKKNVSLKSFKIKLITQLLGMTGLDISENTKESVSLQFTSVKPKENNVKSKGTQTKPKKKKIKRLEIQTKPIDIQDKMILAQFSSMQTQTEPEQSQHVTIETQTKSNETQAKHVLLASQEIGHWPINKEKFSCCSLCTSKGIPGYASRTCVYCTSCDVALCINCFYPYHEEIKKI